MKSETLITYLAKHGLWVEPANRYRTRECRPGWGEQRYLLSWSEQYQTAVALRVLAWRGEYWSVEYFPRSVGLTNTEKVNWFIRLVTDIPVGNNILRWEQPGNMMGKPSPLFGDREIRQPEGRAIASSVLRGETPVGVFLDWLEDHPC